MLLFYLDQPVAGGEGGGYLDQPVVASVEVLPVYVLWGRRKPDLPVLRPQLRLQARSRRVGAEIN